MKSETNHTSAKPTAAPQKPAADRQNVKKPGGERPSLSGERAEGEGMIAPPVEHAKASQVEGEGSYTATHNYDAGVAKSVAAGNTEKLAKAAADALDGPEGVELRKAEKAAKKGHAS